MTDEEQLSELEEEMQKIMWEKDRLGEKYVELYGQWYSVWARVQRSKEGSNE